MKRRSRPQTDALFHAKDPYDHAGTSQAFLAAVRENAAELARLYPWYARLLAEEDCVIETIQTEGDLYRLPPFSTLFFKRFDVKPEAGEGKSGRRLPALTVTSSGTSGRKSHIHIDAATAARAVPMVINFFRFHGLISARPHVAVLLSWPPKGKDVPGGMRTASGAAHLTPVVKKIYALKKTADGRIVPETEKLVKLAAAADKNPFPVRFVGFPAVLSGLLAEMEARNLSLSLPAGSRVLLGGGWKGSVPATPDQTERETGRAFGADDRPEETPDAALRRRIQERLGIPADHVHEFFSAVEHPVPYLKCPCGHFHIPVYSRVTARDPVTLTPLPDGEEGILDFITPLVSGQPLLSVMTDDLGCVCHTPCPCGCRAPYFDLHGRAGAAGITTCAQSTG